MPDGWEWISIEELADTIIDYRGKTPNKSEKGVPLITAKVIHDGQLREITEYITENEYEIWMKRGFPQKNDVLFTTEGPLGEVAILNIEEKVALAQRVLLIRGKKDVIDNQYLKDALRSKNVKLQIEKYSTGSTVKGIRQSEFRKVKIPLPPLETQHQIVAILEKAENIRRLRAESDALTQRLLQSVFLEMFGDPVTNPMGWEIITLGDICLLIKDGPHISPNYTHEGIPFITVHNVIEGFLNFKNARYISESDYENYFSKYYPEKGDIIYTKGGTTGIAKRVEKERPFGYWVHLALLKIPQAKINPIFLEYCLNSSFCKKQAERYTRGIANRDLVLSQMARIRVILPPYQDQHVFAVIAEKTENQIRKGINEKKSITSLFNTLMDKAFTGELLA